MKPAARWLVGLALVPLLGAAPASTRLYTVRGKVLSPAGAPVAGASVRLIQRDYAAHLAGTAPAESRARSGEDGGFTVTFDLEPIERGQRSGARWLLTVEAPGMARYSEELPRAHSRGRSGRIEDLGGVLLDRGRTAIGRVELPSPGRTASRVSLWPKELETVEPWESEVGADGRFEVEALAAGGYLLLIESDGEPALFGGEHAITDRLCFDAGPERGPVCDLGTVRAGPPRRLAGRVVGDRGEPLSGIELTLAPGFDSRLPESRLLARTRSDERGFFTLPVDRAAVRYGVTARGTGHRRRNVHHEVGADAGDRLELPEPLVLEPATRLAGRVVDETGRGIAAARILAREGDDHRGRWTVAGSDGRFSFEDFPAAEYLIDVVAPGFASRTVTGHATRRDQPAEELLVVLDRLDTVDLEIVVRAPDGSPVPGVSVELSKEGDAAPHFSDSSETDADGRTRVTHVPVGPTYSLWAHHPDHPRLRRRGLEPRRDGLLELELEAPTWDLVEVAGTVLAADGSPRPGARVALESLAPPGQRREVASDETGAFRLDRVRAGAYRLVVAARGNALSRRELAVTGGMSPLEIRLQPGAVLEGEIRGLDASRLARVRVEAHAEGHVEPLVARIEDGRYRIDGIGPGEWWLRASLGETWIEDTVVVEPGAATVFRPVGFPPLHRVRCRVTLDRRPVANSMVHLYSGGSSGRSYMAKYEDPGVFVFSDVAAGSYHLTYHGVGGGARRPLAVDADLDLHVDLLTGSIEGRVVDAESGSGVPGLAVEASGEVVVSHTSHRFEAVTDAAGRFRLGPMIAGSWSLVARERRETVASENVRVAAGSATPATLRVGAAEGLRVRVESESGQPPSFVQLTLRDEDGESVAHGSARLDAAAEGRWREAPAGRWVLWAGDGHGWVSTTVEIPGETVLLRFPLAGSLRVEVPALMIETEIGAELVVDFQGESRAGRPATRCRKLSAERRWFYLTDLQPGLWSVGVTADDGRVWTGQVEIRPSEIQELVLPP